MSSAIIPGSFDPITSGHLDIITRTTFHFEKVIVAVVRNPGKIPLFTLEKRVQMVEEALGDNTSGVEVHAFSGLLVDFAQKIEAGIIVKGLRAVTDFEHELQMAQLNRKLAPETETVFMMASPEYAYLSSSAVKEIAQYGGCVARLVPKNVEEPLRRVFA